MRPPLSLLALVLLAVSASAQNSASSAGAQLGQAASGGKALPVYWAPLTTTAKVLFEQDLIPAPPTTYELDTNSPLCLIAPAADMALDSKSTPDALAYLKLVRHAIWSPTMTKKTPRYEIRCGIAADPDMNQPRVTGAALNSAFVKYCKVNGSSRLVQNHKRFTSTTILKDGESTPTVVKMPFEVITASFRDLVKPDREEAVVIEALKVMRLIELYDSVAQTKNPTRTSPYAADVEDAMTAPGPLGEIKALAPGFAQLAAMVVFDGKRSSVVRVEAIKTLATLSPNLAGARLLYRRFELSDDEEIRAAAVEGFTLAVLDMWAYDQNRRDLVTVNVPDPNDDQRITPRRPLCRIGSFSEDFVQLTKKQDPKNQNTDTRGPINKAAKCVYPALRALTPPLPAGVSDQDENIKQFCKTSAG